MRGRANVDVVVDDVDGWNVFAVADEVQLVVAVGGGDDCGVVGLC